MKARDIGGREEPLWLWQEWVSIWGVMCRYCGRMHLTVGPWACSAYFSEIWYCYLQEPLPHHWRFSAPQRASDFSASWSISQRKWRSAGITSEYESFCPWPQQLVAQCGTLGKPQVMTLFSVIVPRFGWVGHEAVSLGKGERKGVSEGVHGGYQWHLCSEHILLVVRRATRDQCLESKVQL